MLFPFISFAIVCPSLAFPLESNGSLRSVEISKLTASWAEMLPQTERVAAMVYILYIVYTVFTKEKGGEPAWK